MNHPCKSPNMSHFLPSASSASSCLHSSPWSGNMTRGPEEQWFRGERKCADESRLQPVEL